ncbi:MAG TPA: acyl-CoA dehydrogenase family protein [Candidatus Binataceae bacterium]|nr:acyl-CoA dehydrogenase family protein [Candidatus Binataceae bacterium]
MSDIGLIEDTARRIITDGLTPALIEAAEHGTWAGTIWDQLETQGLLQLSAIAEGDNAAEGLEIEAAVLRATAATALPLPVAETALAGWFMQQHGVEIPSGVLTVASFASGERLSFEGGRVSGKLERVPWGGRASGVVAIADGKLVLLDPRSASVTAGINMANEPRDTLSFNGAPPMAAGKAADQEEMLARCAAVRALQLAEAAARVLEISVEYAGQRKQFGKPIGGFQAIQHQLAAAAGEVASARVAAQQAYLALATGKHAVFPCAIAKARANEAAGNVARIGHQVHGAIGFTQEYQLHRFTRRIQSWRGEFGASAFWNRRLGEMVLVEANRSLWSMVASGV